MTEPDQIFQPADELDQLVPIGGADEYGHEIPQQTVPVQAIGIVRTRQAPPLIRVAGNHQLAAGDTFKISGPTPQRRRLAISVSEAVYVCDSEHEAANNLGLIVPLGTIFEIFDTGEVWVKMAFGAGSIVVSWWHEMDAG